MDKWIKEAFEDAERSSVILREAEAVMEDFMDNHSTELLDGWAETEDKQYVQSLFRALNKNDMGIMALRSLCAQFFINGYLIGKKDK